jgi:phosphatidylserine/phosphatidylglycerophosphate/cardiolipin synthase-like enzyme
MTKRSSRQKSTLSSLLAVLGLLIVGGLWIIQEFTGIDLGLFGVAQPTPAVVSRMASGDWYQLYFTVPQEQPTWSGGLDEILAADIDGAQHSIDVAAYDFDLESLTSALIRAHDRGVAVRMVTDSDNAELDQPLELIDAGIPVVEDNRSAIMHDKFVVIDGQITWTGSWNLTDNGTYLNNNNALRITSPEIAANYATEFAEMFDDNEFGPKSPADTPYPVLQINETEIRTLFAPEDHVMEAVIEAVSEAQESIRFMAYSFTDEALGAEMMARASAGVLVEGVFEARGAESEYSQYLPLQEAGLQVWKDGNPAVMHHKVIIIDRAIVITGSFNYSTSADKSNDENLMIVYDPQIAAKYLEEFDRVVAKAR